MESLFSNASKLKDEERVCSNARVKRMSKKYSRNEWINFVIQMIQKEMFDEQIFAVQFISVCTEITLG